MARIDDKLIIQRQQFIMNGLKQQARISARKIRPAYTAFEKRIPYNSYLRIFKNERDASWENAPGYDGPQTGKSRFAIHLPVGIDLQLHF